MEKQKVLYEEKALVALQQATQDKTEAVGKAATLQVKGIPTSRNLFPCLYVLIIVGCTWTGHVDARLSNKIACMGELYQL